MTRDEVLRVMGIIATEFGALFEVSEERAMLWTETLGKLAFHEAQRAAIALLVEDREFPPRVGEVYQRALMVRDRDRREAESRRPLLPAPIPVVTPEMEAEREAQHRRSVEEFRKLIDEKFPNLRNPGLGRLG